MKRSLASLCFSLALSALCIAPVAAYWQSRSQVSIASGGGGTCTEATNYIARLTSPTVGQQTAFTTFICGMVSDGTWAKTDALWILTQSSGSSNHLLNAVGNYSAMTTGATPTCNTTDNTGCTGNGSTQFFDTNLTPGGSSSTSCSGAPCYGQNAGTIFLCNLSNRTTASDYADYGQSVAGAISSIYILNSGANSYYQANDIAFVPSTVPTTTLGFWAVNRVDASTKTLSRGNGGSFSLLTTDSAAVAGSIASAIDLYLFAENTAGSAGRFSAANLALFGVGQYSGAQLATIYSRVNTLTTAFGLSGC